MHAINYFNRALTR